MIRHDLGHEIQKCKKITTKFQILRNLKGGIIWNSSEKSLKYYTIMQRDAMLHYATAGK